MQPIFSRNEDFRRIAFLNWRISKNDNIENLINLADGFLMSAIELAKACLINNKDKKADILIFPILTNANHGIELYLKAISWILNKLMNSDFKTEKHHNIKQLFDTTKSQIRKYKGHISLKSFNIDTLKLKSYIDELFEKINATPRDDKMDFSRYPFSNGHTNHFYVDAIGNVEIDLDNFINRFEIISKNLENISAFLYDQELNHDW